MFLDTFNAGFPVENPFLGSWRRTQSWEFLSSFVSRPRGRGTERRTESWNGSGGKGRGRVPNSIGTLPTIPGCSKPLPTCPGMFWGGFGQELFGIWLGQVSFLGKDVGKRVSAKNPRKHRELWERDIFHPGAGVFRTELGRFGGPWEFAFPVSLSLVPPNPLKSL